MNPTKGLRKILLNGSALFLLLITFIPFYLMIVSTLKYQMQIYENPWYLTLPLHFDNYVNAFEKVIFPIFNSLVVTGIGIVFVLIAATLAAYSFARFSFPLKNLLYTSIIVLLMIPGFVLLVPQFIQIKSMGLYNSFLGQAIPPAANYTALGVLLMRAFFEGIPRTLLEAAEIEGAGELRILTRMVLPLSLPVIAITSIMTGLAIWNNFIWSLVITRGDTVKPVILAITSLVGDVNQGDGLRLAGYVIGSLPLLILFLVATKPFISGMTAGAVKG